MAPARSRRIADMLSYVIVTRWTNIWALAAMLGACAPAPKPESNAEKLASNANVSERSSPNESAESGIEEVSEVGAPEPIALPRAMPTASQQSAGGGLPTNGAPSDDDPWSGTELIEERFPDGKPKLSRRVRRDADGIVNHGPFCRWHPNGVIAEEGLYLDGDKDGLYVIRYDSGLPRVEASYLRGREHGRSRRWSDVGVLLHDANYVEGELDGFEQSWFENGQPKLSQHWKLGVEHGATRKWSGRGEVIEEGESIDGARVGEWTMRRADGTLERRETYVAGRLHGPSTEYDEQGRLSAERSYADGVAQGIHREFWPSGGPKSETTYNDGQADGMAIRWWDNGQKESEGTQRAGVKEGPWKFWKSDGSVDAMLSGVYSDGQRSSD